MEQFNLGIWLQDKSRKVTTRLGNREVRIICWDRKNNNNRPIITLMIDPDGNEYTTFHTKNGFVDEKEEYIDKRDLFFAEEEKKYELTEFEKTMIQFSHERNSLIQFEHTTEEINAHLYLYSEKLLDLAKEKILKDLPKWKKATEDKDFDRHVLLLEDRVVIASCVYKDEYYLELNNLTTLPKEE